MDRRSVLKSMAATPIIGRWVHPSLQSANSAPRVSIEAEQNNPTRQFSSSARWIWDHAGEYGAWWMFRKTFVVPPAGVKSSTLCITSCLCHIAYVNGKIVDRGPAPSYDFAKHYAVVDVAPLLIPAERNVIAVVSLEIRQKDSPPECPSQGLLAELTLHSPEGTLTHIASDCTWKVHRDLSFRSDVPGDAIPLRGPEEWFDARNALPGWTLADYDDSRWDSARELGPVGTPPWTGVEEHRVAALTNDFKHPVRFAAMELAADPSGYLLRLGAPFEGLALFATEITCAQPATVRIRVLAGQARVSLDGDLVDQNHQVGLAAGSSLLCCCSTTATLELLIETGTPLQFSARRLTGSGMSEWGVAQVRLEGQLPRPFEYPWEGNPWDEAEVWNNDLTSSAPALALLSVRSVEAFPKNRLSNFQPAHKLAPGVMEQVTHQIFYAPPGGFAQPAIEAGEPREPAGEILRMLSPASMLHNSESYCTVLPAGDKHVHFIVDFDRETIGHVHLKLDAPAGTVVDVQCFELIDGSGIEWMNVRNGFRYVCREGMQEFVSHYRRGFRYASITLRDFARPVRFYSICCEQTAYPIEELGGFECSDELLNTVFRMSADTASLCMLENYVDCPGHEQNFWVGDARITALINLTLFGAYDLNQSFIRIVGQSLRPEWVKEYRPTDERYLNNHYLPIAAFPSYPEGCLPMWSFLWIMQCWEHYFYGGNRDDLKENFGYVARALENCRRLTNERGQLDMPGAWNLIDWGNNDLSAYGEVTANNVLLAKCLRLAARMAAELRETGLAADFDAEAARRTAAINGHCWDRQHHAYVDTVRDEWAYQRYCEWSRAVGRRPVPLQKYLGYKRISEQTNTLALVCGCVPADRQDAVEQIVARVKNGHYVAGAPAQRTSGVPSEAEAPGGIVAVGSPFFLFFSLEALFQRDMPEIALNIIRRDWGAMVAAGTRTCWETFKYDERHWTRSVCHAWSAAPAVYLPSRVLGIRPVEPGYRKFVIAPCASDLQWARGSVATPYGPIFASWSRDSSGKVRITCSAPNECERLDGNGHL